MKKFTRFQPFGHGGRPGEPLGKTIYNASILDIGYDRNFSRDTNLAGEIFADSMIQASSRIMMDKAKSELHPLSTNQFLGLHEQENGIVQVPGQTKSQRRRLLYIIKRLSIDGRASTIHQTLQELLGDDLVGYRTVRINELTTAEKNPNPTGNQSTWETPLRVSQFDVPVVRRNVSLRVPISFVGGDPEAYSVGQNLVVDAGRFDRAEVVTLTAVTSSTITGRFTKPHDKGAKIAGGHHPRHWSGKRTHLIMLRNGKAMDPIITGQVDQIMRRLVKGSARWYCIDETTSFTSGPFKVNAGLLGATTIGATTV